METAVRVGVIMGSASDYEVMAEAVRTLGEFGVGLEKRVVSAHRTPDLLCEYAKTARGRGIRVIIAGAGGAAHLPGMVASMTTLPVVGVPVKSRGSGGHDRHQRGEERRFDSRFDTGLAGRGACRAARRVPRQADRRRAESRIVG